LQEKARQKVEWTTAASKTQEFLYDEGFHMENNILASVIIPVYNVENYLTDCVDSLLAAVNQNVELLFINDGSTDSSLSICRQYADSHSNIRLFSKANGGLSSARNYGIKEAQGIFIIFVDSDDFVLPQEFLHVLEELLHHAHRPPDVIGNDILRYTADGYFIRATKKCKHLDGRGLKDYLRGWGSIWNSWRYIFSRTFILENALWFKEGALCEDVDHTTRALRCARTWSSMYQPYYCYRQGRAESIMNIVSRRRIDSFLTIIQEQVKSIRDTGSTEVDQLLEQKLIGEFLLSTLRIYEFSGEEQAAVRNLFQKTATFLDMGYLPVRPVSYLLSIARKFYLSWEKRKITGY